MKTRIFLAFLLSSLCTLCLCGESFAALDPELKTPYQQLKVVLHFADNRLLTPIFRDRVARELHDGLQASFGDLVSDIEVTGEDARLNDVLQNGLKSLDNWRERSPVKTHFVLIDYSGVDYTIQARQFDGLTGRPSPMVRRDRTRDRGFVAKTAALLIDQDFGLVGTFDIWPKEDKPGEDKPVVVSLKGAGLGVSLDRWIKKGDLFAAVQMPFGDRAPGTPVDGAILRVETPPAGADSTCLCRPFRRYAALTGGAGFRCVKLGTVSAPLRLRLRQALANNRDGPLNDALSVQIRRHGFDDEAMTRVQKQTDSLDAVDTAGDKDPFYNGVAFVTVASSEGKVRARVPIPILDEQPVVLPVNVTDAGTELAFQKAAWERDVTQTWQQQNEWIREINEGVKAEKHADVIAKIEEGLKRFQSEVNSLTDQQKKLEIGQGDPNVERLKQVQDGIAKLMEYRDKLKKIDEEENDPKKKEWLAQAAQGKQLEDDWELGKAIALYEELLKADTPNQKLKNDLAEHLDKLRKEWEPKSDAHREARAFIYNDWPEIKDDAVLLEKLPEARKAFDVCKTVKDKAGLIRLFKGTEVHAVRMNQELKTLKPDINIDDEKQAKTIQDASKGLAALAHDVNAALARAAPAGK